MPEDLLSDFRVHACLREERRARVAQRVERESPGQRSQPERAAVFRTPALRAIRRALDVATARFSAAMLVFLDDAGAPASVCGFRFGSLNLGSSSRLTGFGRAHQPTDGSDATA